MFNENSRTQNTLIVATISEVCTIINQLMGFVYRTIFIYILSAEYLGLNGLFSNILSLLSLADLGISSAIVFRFYKPISDNDYVKVGQLMNFFKQIYHIILLVILGIGVLLLPFIPYFLNDTSEVPSDINLYLVYILFLIQTASSYMFAYKQTLLTADQKQYKVSLFQTLLTLVRYIVQIILLFATKDYQVTLAVSILLTIIGNFFFSMYVTKLYREVFAVKKSLSKSEKWKILNDTKACMCHRVGASVLSSTDNLVLSKMVGLFYVGVYSNYYLITNCLNNLANQVLANATASIGNAHTTLTKSDYYRVYRNMEFVNLWFASSLTVCLYVMLNAFMNIWMGSELLFDELTVICLCVQFYLEMSRQINISFTNASGLFVRDIWRPIIEAVINLVVSIVLVKFIGISGVFLGTIISCLVTVFWREPYLLFKYDFKKNPEHYWVRYILFVIITFTYAALFKLLVPLHINNFIQWALYGILCLAGIQVILIMVFYRTSEFKYLCSLLTKITSKFQAKLAS